MHARAHRIHACVRPCVCIVVCVVVGVHVYVTDARIIM